MADLNETHRCDRCGAQAKAAVMFSSGVLMFCTRHYRANAQHMTGVLAVVDETGNQ